MNRKQLELRIAAAKLVKAYRAITPVLLATCERIAGRKIDIHVARPGDVVPDNYADLRYGISYAGQLCVDYSNSASSIYGRDGNVSFRTMHDLGHYAYRKCFTLKDECELAHVLWDLLVDYIEPGWREYCHKVYLADTVEQSLYEAVYGEFPTDQTAFVLAVLAA